MTGTKARFPYFKFYPRDWLEATRSMSLEQRGAYIDLICILMEMEGHLRDDDRWISHQMHISTRKWKAVKTALVEHKKIRIDGDLIIQERCLKELDALLNQSRTRAESATNRERTKRENRENINEFNVGDGTVVPLRARDSDSDSEEERKNPPVCPPAGGPQRSPAPPVKVVRQVAAAIAGAMVMSAPLAAQPGQMALLPEPDPVAAAPQPVLEKPKKEDRAHRFREGWRPSERTIAWAKNGDIGATPEQIERQFEAFVDHHVSRGSKFTDWDRAFQTWMRNARHYGHLRANGPGSGAKKISGSNGSNYSFSGNYVGELL